MENSRANIVIVDEQEQLHKILQVRSRLPKLKAIIQCKGELDKVYPDVFTWTKFLEVSKDMEDSVIDDIISKQQPNQCAMVVYSSGTTGTSKGIMLSHDNLTWASYAFCDMYDIGGKTCNEMRTVNYGSLAHIGPRNVNMLFPIPVGGTVYFAQPDAMEGSLVDTIKEVQPTVFYGQPRVWEEIRRKVEIDNYTTKEEFGFGKCQLMLTGGSSANPKTLAFFLAMDMPIRESYGTSENTGSAAVGTAARSGCGKKCLIGTEIKIGSPGNGEVLIRGRPVAMGYLGMEQKTREAIDDERWLHTGDIGRMDENGLLYITGRIKELVILQNGVNVAPNYIENHIKFEIPFLSNVVLAGEGKNYLTCLLTLKCVMDPDSGEATDNLLPQVIKMFEELGTNCTTVSQVINSKDKIVFKAIQDGIDYYNTQHSQTDLDKVKKWVLLDKDFTVASGELGPTLKLKRPTVLKKHARLIEGLYEEC
ncbi:long-chain-fatty-acid--CoA ligase ACSBG2-like isoform X2 [Dysidea avara]